MERQCTSHGECHVVLSIYIQKHTSAALVYNRNGRASGFWRFIRCHFRGGRWGREVEDEVERKGTGRGERGDVEEEVGSQGKEDEGDTR